MSYSRVVYLHPHKKYRIVELSDDGTTFDDLCGDTYSPEANPDIPPDELEREKAEFLAYVTYEGVFGYSLEKWNPKPGAGWEPLDSCWGFVGHYSPKSKHRNHYIIEELKTQMPSLLESILERLG